MKLLLLIRHSADGIERSYLLDLRKLPLLIAQGADRAGLKPSRDAVHVEDVAATAESNRVAVHIRQLRVGLGLNGGLVELVAADGTSIRADIPTPQGDGAPLLDLEARLFPPLLPHAP